MQVIISGAALQSAYMCAAKDDIRYYLNSVYVEWNPTTTRIVSTTGHYLYIQDESPKVDENTGTGSLLIPREVLDRIKPHAKGTVPHYVLTAELDTTTNWPKPRYTCKLRHIAETTETTFLSGEGVFPNYTRVIPSFAAFDLLEDKQTEDFDNVYFAPDIAGKPTIKCDPLLAERMVKRFECREEVASYNFDYLTLAMKVQKVHHGAKTISPRLYQNGRQGGLIKFTDNAFLVIMPMRNDEGNPPVLDVFRSRIEVKEEEPAQVEQQTE